MAFGLLESRFLETQSFRKSCIFAVCNRKRLKPKYLPYSIITQNDTLTCSQKVFKKTS